jgi:MinD superfamily P-loop ATPase
LKVAIASGKGGTGKTTIATNLAAALAKNTQEVQLLDCDAEEPNAHLFFNPLDVRERAVESLLPSIDVDKCDLCGKCVRICSFSALAAVAKSVLVFPAMCHGCGACARFCPRDAITEEPRRIGVVANAEVGDLSLTWGRTEIGVPLAPAVINEVHRETKPQAGVIVDASPGTSCSAVAGVTGADICLLVTEPTPFGLHDLKLAVAMTRELRLSSAVVLNRVGLGDRTVQDYCSRESIPVVLEIPFDRRLAACYARGLLWVDEFPEWEKRFADLWGKIEGLVQ